MAKKHENLVSVHLYIHSVHSFEPVVVNFPKIRNFENGVVFLFLLNFTGSRLKIVCFQILRIEIIAFSQIMRENLDFGLSLTAWEAQTEKRVLSLAKSLGKYLFEVKSKHKHDGSASKQLHDSLEHAVVFFLEMPGVEVHRNARHFVLNEHLE